MLKAAKEQGVGILALIALRDDGSIMLREGSER
jgi:hypothetical protein